MQWLVNTSLLKVIRRDVWLCKLTYPIIYRLTLNKLDLRQTNNVLFIKAITFNLSNQGNHLWNDIITVLSANFAQVSATQIRASSKENGIRWCQQFNKPGPIGRIERDWLKGYELRTNHVNNTTSVSSCNLKQVTPTKYLNQKYG